MLEYITLILVCQLIGEVTVTVLDIPFPGPVAGMLLLFAFLLVNGTVPARLSEVSSALLNHLSLLFVPAGVGVILHLDILGDDLVPLSAAMIISTVFAIVVTGGMMAFFNRRASKHPAPDDGTDNG